MSARHGGLLQAFCRPAQAPDRAARQGGGALGQAAARRGRGVDGAEGAAAARGEAGGGEGVRRGGRDGRCEVGRVGQAGREQGTDEGLASDTRGVFLFEFSFLCGYEGVVISVGLTGRARWRVAD